MIKFQVQTTDDQYLPILTSAIEVQFPGTMRTYPCAVFEAVTTEIIGSKQQRYGPTPDPETLVSIREVVRRAIEGIRSVPVLVPWGGSKQGQFGLDAAELFALRQLQGIDSRIREHYSPGLEIRIRIEDSTDNVLFAGQPGWRSKTREYSDKMVKLAQAMGFKPMLESDLLDQSKFESAVSELVPALKQAMTLSESSRKLVLRDIGWEGNLPNEQIEHYIRVYSNFYPHLALEERLAMVARYFAAGRARRILDAQGYSRDEPKPLIFAFTPAIPGQPKTRRVFLRTVPERFQSSHRPPWIGKGYTKIRGREATPAVAGWTGDGLEYQRGRVFASLENSTQDQVVEVEFDYVVVD